MQLFLKAYPQKSLYGTSHVPLFEIIAYSQTATVSGTKYYCDECDFTGYSVREADKKLIIFYVLMCF